MQRLRHVVVFPELNLALVSFHNSLHFDFASSNHVLGLIQQLKFTLFNHQCRMWGKVNIAIVGFMVQSFTTITHTMKYS